MNIKMREHELKMLDKWAMIKEKPLIIAGPCSAESENQIINTAYRLSRISDVSIFRAGIWKPRTRPNSFEGVGKEGLKWLQRVKKETGMPTATEVANANHVYEALKYGIDVLWIGARTSVNPFSVQEIADALYGVDIPILVKNPVSPDINSWIGAIERVAQSGIKRLGAIHRGFSTIEKSPYRNAPKWEIPVELKRLMPEIPVFCDPSHIAGNREPIAELSQIALDLAMEGLMIETHMDPDNAISDAKQQVTPDTLETILTRLIIRRPEGDGTNGQDILKMLRQEIDQVDWALIELLQRRTEIATKMGDYKKAHNMTILQVNRWQELLKNRLEKARNLGIDEKMVKEIYQILHKQSFKIQSDLLNRKD
jgi:chorismate mutase